MAKKTRSTKKKGGCLSGGCTGGKRRTQRMRGGMYGFNGGVITAGTLEAGAAYSGAADPKTGAAIPDPALAGTRDAGSYTGVGGRRRKTSKKTRKGKGKKSRKMRGGSSQVSAMKSGYGFNGSGAGGLADAVSTPTSGGNAF